MREELGYIGVFAAKGREQEQKRPGLIEIFPFIFTSAIRASILSFHSLQDNQLSPLEVAAFIGDCEIPPQRGRGNNTGVYDKGEGEHFTKVCC